MRRSRFFFFVNNNIAIPNSDLLMEIAIWNSDIPVKFAIWNSDFSMAKSLFWIEILFQIEKNIVFLYRSYVNGIMVNKF